MGIGPERTPGAPFSLITTPDEEIVAIVLRNEIQMIHEFSSGFTWPGPYTNVTEHKWEAAEPMIAKLLKANDRIRCSRQDGYRRFLDRRAENRG